MSCLIGRFFGVDIDGWSGLAVAAFILWSGYGIARETMSTLLGEELGRMLPNEPGAPVLVIGLGNRFITPDSLGPCTIDRTLVTRHMIGSGFAPENMRSVCAVAPGVLGVTGIETDNLE